MKLMKKLIMVLVLFCWCINIYGQESITDTTAFIYTDVTDDDATIDMLPYYLNPLIELYEEYETQCFNDSTKQCFNYYNSNNNFYFYGLTQGEAYKTPCTKMDMDLGIDPSYSRTGEEWVHVQPSFMGFMKYLKKKRD